MFSRKKEIQKKKTKTASIIIVSLIIAFGINFLYLNNNPDVQQFKADVLNGSLNYEKGDIYLQKEDGRLLVKSNTQIDKVKTISFSIFYDPENFKINEIKSTLTENIVNQNEVEGTNLIILTFADEVTFAKSDFIAEISYNKIYDKLVNVNISNINFTDNENNLYEGLTSSGEEL